MSSNPHTAKHAFFYLIAFFTLGFTATAIGQVVFQLINRVIVETTPSYSGDFSEGVLRFATSSLIIAAPIYYYFTRKINIELAAGELEKDSSIRKWLTYIAIFIAAAVAIGDLIFTLNSFLAGEITLKFLLKAATIFAIAGGFGSYYFLDLRRENLQRDLKMKIFGAIFITIAVAALVTSFTLIDSPKKARELREDSERTNGLRSISYAVTDFYRSNERLPQTLDELVDDFKLREEILLDPVSEEKYEFKILGSQKYELCAVFMYSDEDKNSRDRFVDPEWTHTAGRQCFEIDISKKEDYPFSEVRPLN